MFNYSVALLLYSLHIFAVAYLVILCLVWSPTYSAVPVLHFMRF